jgi:hypothetical protein
LLSADAFFFWRAAAHARSKASGRDDNGHFHLLGGFGVEIDRLLLHFPRTYMIEEMPLR